MGLLNKIWSQTDLWDKEENKRQAQAVAKPMPARAPQPQQNVIQRAAPTGLRAGLGVAVATLPGANTARAAYKLLNRTKPGKAVLAGGKRSAIGTGQALSGLYDLATPGTGTNRISKTLDVQAKQVDQSVKRQKLNPVLYKGGQLGGDIATGLGAGGVTKWAGKGLVKAAPVLGNVPKAATAIEQGVNKVVAPLAKSNFAGRVAGKAISNIANPKYQGVNALYTAQQIGKEASQGKKITPQRVATDAAVGGVAFPAAGALGGEALRTVARPVVKAARNAHLIRPTNLNDTEVARLSTFVDNRGTNGMTEEVYNRGIAAAQKAGLNPYDVSAMDRVIGDHMTFNTRRAVRKETLQNIKDRLSTPLGEGGYVRIPGSNQTDDPLNNKIAATQLYKAAQRAGKAESNPKQLNQASLSSQPQLLADQLKSIVPDNMTHSTPRSGQLSLADHNIPPQGQISDRLAQPAHHTPEGRTPYNNNTPFDANRYVKEQTKLQEKARKAEFGSSGEKLGAIRQDFSTKMIDSFTPIEKALKQAQKVAEIAPENNVTYQIDRVIRSNGIADTFIKDNGLDRIIQNVPNTKEFDQYLIAKHARELGKEITTGRNATKDAALVQALDTKYAPFAKELYGYNQRLLDTAVSYGLISKDAAASLKEKYPEYVPFNRIFADGEVTLPAGVGKGKASISQQNVVKGIKGSKRQIESPLSSIIDKTQAVIEQGERNKAAKMISSYKNIPGNPFDLKEISAKETIGQRHTISFLDNGKKRTFETTKEISDAAKNMTQEQIGLIGQVLAAPARVLRLGATGVNIGFTASNVIKDIIGAAVNSRNALSSSPLNLSAMGKALAAALRHDGKYYQELMREGVAGTSFDLARNSARLNVKEIRSQKNLGTRALHNANPLRWVRTLENTIGRSEDFGRALQYYGNKAAFEKKMSPERAKILAADQARFNSTNFARAGTYGRVINSVVPYSNAAIQGARIGVRRIKERPVATIGKMVATIGAPSAFIALNNYSDPEKRKVMENIPAYEREGNIIIVGDNPVFNEKTGRWEGVTKIPVPPQFKAIHDSIQRGVYSAMTGEKFDVGKTVGDTSENLTTVNVNGDSGLLKTASTYTPQTAKLFFEPMFNRNMFTGQQIVPDAMKNIDAKNQHTKSTSLTAKNIGQALNVSPMQVDNFVRTSMAGSGQNLIRLSDEALAMAGKGTKEDVRGQGLKESITDRFIGSKGQSDATLYYKSFEDAAKANKLNGRDYNQLKTLLSKETDANGIPVAKDEKDKMTANAIYANSPALSKTRADAAKMFAKQTGEGYDPLYDLPIDKQVIFYKSQGLPKNSAEQRNIFEKNKWITDLKKNRAEYFKTVDMNKASASGMVPYPEPSQQVQNLLDQYTGITDSKVRVQFMKDHPEVGQHFGDIAKYTNDVRQAQGFDPLRTYTQPSARVQQLLDTMGSKAYRDPEVAAWSQANAVYNATKDAALAQIQGNDLSSKALGAFNSIAKYDMVKNPNGTYSLRYGDPQGGGQNIAQPGAFAVGGFSSFGKRGKKGRKMGLSNPTYSSANRRMQSALKSTRTRA